MKTIIKTTSLLLLFIVCSNTLAAQNITRSVFGGAGGYLQNSEFGDLHFTLGEIVTNELVSDFALSQGFHHIHRDLISTNTAIVGIPQFDLRIYPNPTAEILFIETNLTKEYDLKLTDIVGRQLLSKDGNSDFSKINLQHLPDGLYFLSIQIENVILKTLKVQKTAS